MPACELSANDSEETIVTYSKFEPPCRYHIWVVMHKAVLKISSEAKNGFCIKNALDKT